MGLFPLKSSPHLFSHVIFTEILREKSVTKAVIVNPTFQNKNQGISSYKRLEESKQKSVLTFYTETQQHKQRFCFQTGAIKTEPRPGVEKAIQGMIPYSKHFSGFDCWSLQRLL